MNPDNLKQIFTHLNQAGVQYLVVGGLAVMAHGYLRMTRDLDLVIALETGNLRKALSVFQVLGYRPNVPVSLMDFADPAKRKAWQVEKNMQVFQIVSERFRDCPIDLFIEEPIAFSEMYSARTPYLLDDDLSLPVVGLPHLIALKRLAGRPRDLLDIAELEALDPQDEITDQN
jgi:hypothetical protein